MQDLSGPYVSSERAGGRGAHVIVIIGVKNDVGVKSVINFGFGCMEQVLFQADCRKSTKTNL